MTDSNSIIRKRQEIVSKLTQARLEKGLSQAQLAEMVGTQRSNICRIENGGQNLSLDLLIKITDALGKDVSVLLEEKGVEMSNVYNLKLYDDILVTFSLEEKGLEGLVVEVLSYDESKKHLFSDVMHRMQDMLFVRVENRVAQAICQRAELSEKPEITVTHEQLANQINSSREVVSRILKSMEKQNILRLDRGKITILNRNKLTQLR